MISVRYLFKGAEGTEIQLHKTGIFSIIFEALCSFNKHAIMIFQIHLC